jgi:hypothetical protein
MQNNMKTSLCILLAALFIFSSSSKMSAQLACTAPSPDHLFAESGKSMVTISTGIPYVGIAEYAYGISSKTTIGLMYGQTPLVEAYGIRIRTIISEPTENLRIYFRSPIFYYPKTHDMGGEPWFLAWPVFNIEYKRDCGRRMWAGIGAIGAACAHSIGKTFGVEKEREEMGEGFKGGIWNTVQIGGTQPLGEHVVIQAEFGLVMSGLKPAGSDWVGGPPVLLITGLSYTF